METGNSLKMIHISDLSNAHSINEDDLLLISKYDETIDKNYVSMRSTIGQLQSNISSAVKEDIGIDDINNKINTLIDFRNNLSSYTISCDINNPYIISSMVFRYGVLHEAGGYELLSTLNLLFKTSKFDKINTSLLSADRELVKSLSSTNLSSNTGNIKNLTTNNGNISNLNITHISSNGHELGEEWTFVLEDGTEIQKTVFCYNKP